MRRLRDDRWWQKQPWKVIASPETPNSSHNQQCSWQLTQISLKGLALLLSFLVSIYSEMEKGQTILSNIFFLRWNSNGTSSSICTERYLGDWHNVVTFIFCLWGLASFGWCKIPDSSCNYGNRSYQEYRKWFLRIPCQGYPVAFCGGDWRAGLHFRKVHRCLSESISAAVHFSWEFILHSVLGKWGSFTHVYSICREKEREEQSLQFCMDQGWRNF